MAPAHLPRLNEISIDPAVILFTLAAALVTGILFGMIPVIQVCRSANRNRAARRRTHLFARAGSGIARAACWW